MAWYFVLWPILLKRLMTKDDNHKSQPELTATFSESSLYCIWCSCSSCWIVLWSSRVFILHTLWMVLCIGCDGRPQIDNPLASRRKPRLWLAKEWVDLTTSTARALYPRVGFFSLRAGGSKPQTSVVYHLLPAQTLRIICRLRRSMYQQWSRAPS